MTNLYELSDRDICQPPWLTKYITDEFSEYLYHYDDEYDYDDYIHPIEADGTTQFLFKSCLGEILKMQTSREVQSVEEFLRSIDLLQREYLPSEHFGALQRLVSLFSLILSLF